MEISLSMATDQQPLPGSSRQMFNLPHYLEISDEQNTKRTDLGSSIRKLEEIISHDFSNLESLRNRLKTIRGQILKKKERLAKLKDQRAELVKNIEKLEENDNELEELEKILEELSEERIALENDRLQVSKEIFNLTSKYAEDRKSNMNLAMPPRSLQIGIFRKEKLNSLYDMQLVQANEKLEKISLECAEIETEIKNSPDGSTLLTAMWHPKPDKGSR